MNKPLLITGNEGKRKEVEHFLGFPIETMKLDLEEIQSLDLMTIVRHKVMQAYDLVQRPVLVEDVSFVFPALGKLPGPFIKWFEAELGHERLCRLLDGQDRSCTATVLYGFYGGGQVYFFEGSMTGTVAEHPRGEGSFGWSNIFIPAGMSKTYAELTDEERDQVAMRKNALEKLLQHLEKY